MDGWTVNYGTYLPGQIIIGPAALLSAQLTNFSAHLVDDRWVEIAWRTVSEINNAHFELQRSSDGINFETFGIVNGSGTSITVNNYRYKDVEPYQGNSYYRIMQVDYDGKFDFSNIKSVRMTDKSYPTVFPNPVKNSLFIESSNKIDTIKLFNSKGEKIYIEYQSSQSKLDMSQLRKGLYQLIIISESKTYHRTIIKL